MGYEHQITIASRLTNELRAICLLEREEPLMCEAAAHAKVDPDRVSFVAALRIARRSVA